MQSGLQNGLLEGRTLDGLTPCEPPLRRRRMAQEGGPHAVGTNVYIRGASSPFWNEVLRNCSAGPRRDGGRPRGYVAQPAAVEAGYTIC